MVALRGDRSVWRCRETFFRLHLKRRALQTRETFARQNVDHRETM